MTEPTTKPAEHEVPPWGGPTIAGEKRLVAQPAGSLAIRGEGWTDDQRAVLRAMGLEHADEGDLKLFHHYAQRTGLDPFTRQVYMVGRDTEVTVREVNEETGNERDVRRRVTKFTIQVGIDGWRVLGNRAAHRDGVRVGHKAPLYAGKDGVWSSIWTSDANPVACRYVLTADGIEVEAVCYFSEYAQYSGRGELTSMWKKMPLNQLAKCTEALAWRKAFPADFAGLVLEDAVQAEVIDGELVGDEPAKAAPKRAKGAERNRERAHRAAEQQAAEAAPADPKRPAEDRLKWSDETRRKWLNRMFDLFGDCGLAQAGDQLSIIAELGELDALPEHRDTMTDKVLERVVTKLNGITKAAAKAEEPKSAIDAAIDDALRSWEYRQSAGAEQTVEGEVVEDAPAEQADEAQS